MGSLAYRSRFALIDRTSRRLRRDAGVRCNAIYAGLADRIKQYIICFTRHEGASVARFDGIPRPINPRSAYRTCLDRETITENKIRNRRQARVDWA